jgi:hypothetical protein
MRLSEILVLICFIGAVCIAATAYGQTHASATGTASVRILSALDVRLQWKMIDRKNSVTLTPRDSLDDYVYDFAFTTDYSLRLSGDDSFDWPSKSASPAIYANWSVRRVPEAVQRPNNYDVFVQPSFSSLPEIERRYRTTNMVLDAPCVLILNYY